MKHPTLYEVVRRCRPLSREHRIAFLRSIIQTLPARSIRRQELEAYLIIEVAAQLRKECRAA
jgi:hypothetical protein